MTDRRLIVGLGNPGREYDKTRHNAGFWFVHAFAKRHMVNLRAQKKVQGQADKLRIAGQDVVVMTPDTFMNDSGQALRAALDFYAIDVGHVLVAYDDLDLPPGQVRLKHGGGHGGHNGLKSAFAHLGGQNFWRLRIGIGHPGQREQVTPWVLGRASRDDELAIDAAIDRSLAAVDLWLQGQPDQAMLELHSDSSS
ncbi:MAG: aminoacyl-tRNA hydrolase [Wenzhouxiangella sp.]|jgi:PTH1 family peptidyl-tRNA hydrolase|nr:aminoacyl-tRNA hydrolase [Wenzhouxiangella sp.]MDR9452563.1 aminoacyl-tRNA hydrolase [Wenzhouxiangella sp.]